AISGNLGGHYALGSDIDATATTNWNQGLGFSPIGVNNITPFTGTLEGLGHTIGNLTINAPGISETGLFGAIGASGVVQNLGLVGGSVTGKEDIGGLVAINSGRITNVHSSLAVNGGSWAMSVGGLAGFNGGTGIIDSSYTTGDVTDTD